MHADVLRRLAIVREMLAEQPLALSESAREACLSPFHFHRQFTRAFGRTPHEFATERRLERAKTLLLTTDLSVLEICFLVGYESPGSFSALFTRQVGCSPSQFRFGAKRFWQVAGIRTARFIPLCFIQNRKIGDELVHSSRLI